MHGATGSGGRGQTRGEFGYETPVCVDVRLRVGVCDGVAPLYIWDTARSGEAYGRGATSREACCDEW